MAKRCNELECGRPVLVGNLKHISSLTAGAHGRRTSRSEENIIYIYEQERWYSDWTLAIEVMNRLTLTKIGELLIYTSVGQMLY